MAVSWGDLKLAAATDSDKVNDASVTDQQWMIWCKQGVEALYREVASRDPDLYFNSDNFTLTGGVSGATFTLSGTSKPFRAMHGLDLNPDTSSRRTISRRNFQERNRGAVGWWVPTVLADDRAYDIRGANDTGTLVITPFELAAGSYRIYYRYAPTVPDPNAVNLALNIDSQLETWNEFVSSFMAGKALGREESENAVPGTPWARVGELRQEIAASYERDDQEPARIADVESDGGWAWDRV